MVEGLRKIVEPETFLAPGSLPFICPLYSAREFPIDPLCRRAYVRFFPEEEPMLDLIYLALGLGMFGLLGLYAMAADRL